MSGLEECVKLLLTRRSIRKFKDEKVPLELVKEILDVARFAPSARNSQPWEFVVVTDPEIKEELAKIHPWAAPLRRAPIGIIVVCDKGKSPTSYQLDCANVTLYIMLAARACGLGTVWIQALRNQDDIKRIVGIPEEKDPIAILAMGWPAEEPEAKARRSLEELVHLNKYISTEG